MNLRKLQTYSKTVSAKAYDHKFKIVIGVGTLYFMKKCYDAYLYLKPFYDMYKASQPEALAGEAAFK